MAVPPRTDAPVEPPGPGLRRTLSVWQAVGLSVALMAPSTAADINRQGTATTVGRAVLLAWVLVCMVVVASIGGAARRAGAALTAAELGSRREEVGSR